MELKTLEQNQEEWLIDEFVEIANQLLPNYLPEIKSNTKVKEEINPRLVRHYTNQKLMDEPIRKNRYAFYNYRHLLQILLIRRLLSDGIGTMAIDNLLTSKTNQELKNLLIGGVQINLTTSHPKLATPVHNPALEYLAKLKKSKANKSSTNKQLRTNERSSSLNHTFPSNLEQNREANLSFDAQSSTSEWTRLQVLDGLELHIRNDFISPNSIKEQESLNQHLIDILTQWLTEKKYE